jgi:hypothetical protein
VRQGFSDIRPVPPDRKELFFMGIVWGVVLVVLSSICWGGQVISWLAPPVAVKLTLMEGEDTVEPVYYADVRGEARWDTLTLSTMVVAGVLLLADNPAWAYFGLVGGGMYLYFAGRGISTRLEMQRRGYRIGALQNVRVGYVFLTVWGAMALITIIAAVKALPT